MRTKQKILHTGAGMLRIATTLVIGGALALAYACADNRRVEQQMDDGNLTAMLGAKYAFDSEIDRYRIDIDVKNGVVTLRGAVSDEEERQEAERIATNLKGVRSVVNELTIDPTPRTATRAFEDAWIVSMLKSKLGVDPEVKATQIDVDVREGVVTLSGTVDNETAKTEAEDLAWSVDGVRKVVNQLVVRE
jgi:hyperosmotically inducible protein